MVHQAVSGGRVLVGVIVDLPAYPVDPAGK